MRNSNKNILFLFFGLFLAVTGVMAQSNLAFYPLEDHFNSSDFNPAFLYSPEKFTFSIFPFGGSSITFNNQQVIKELVKQSLHGITSDDDYKNVINSITNRSYFNQNVESILVSFTLRSRFGFFNFQIKENQNFSAAVKGELSNFIFSKNIASATIDRIQDLPSQAMHYREYSFGYSLPGHGQKFTWGIRPKIYFGKAAFFSGLYGSIQKKSSDYTLHVGGKVKLSIPMSSSSTAQDTTSAVALGGKNLMNYLLNSGNPGFGIDLGFKYRITPQLTISMSALDLGKIDWNTNLNSKIFDGEYPISKKKVNSKVYENGTEIITKNFKNYSFSDSISNIFNQYLDTTKFSGKMPVKIFGGIKYRLNQKVSISLTDRYIYLKNLNSNSFALIFDIDLNKDLSISTGYSVISNSYSNLPLAILLKKDFGQFYIGSDNILSFIIPSISDFAGFTFGTCFYIFRRKNSSGSKSVDFPFYRAKNPRRDQKTGLILKESIDL